MKMTQADIKLFEENNIKRVSALFKPKSKLHHKWYSVNKDVLNQFGTVVHLFASNPEQIIFFDNKLKEINAIKLTNKWSIGKRISDIRSDKKYEIINPKGEVTILELGSNLYTKVWKGIITKMNTTEI